jgi:hypothetical protein
MRAAAVLLAAFLISGFAAAQEGFVELPLAVNTADNEVLLGFDDGILYFQRVAAAGGPASVFEAVEAQSFEASVLSGWTEFETERAVDIRVVRPASWAELGPLRHTTVDVERGILVGSVWNGSSWDLYASDRMAPDGPWGPPRPLNGLNSSTADEVFPSFHNGDLWFASNRKGGAGGFDLYVGRRKDLWRRVSEVPSYLRTPGDEIAAVPVEGGYLLCAARFDGAGGSDIYYVGPSVVAPAGEGVRWSMELVHDLAPMPDIRVTVRNRGGLVAYRGVTDARGWVDMGPLSLDAGHEVEVRPVRPADRLPELSFAHVYVERKGEARRRVRTYRIDGGVVFAFDMLPLDDLDFEAPEARDAAGLPEAQEVWAVHFPSGGAAVPAGVEPPWELANWPAGWRMILTGFADASGDAQANSELALQRARSVAEWLQSQGVPGGVMDVRSEGERLATGNAAHDRRCEVRVERVGGG